MDEEVWKITQDLLYKFLSNKKARSIIKKSEGEKLEGNEMRDFKNGISKLQYYYEFYKFLEENKDNEAVLDLLNIIEKE
ncbi:MAG: hypothetical protein ACOC44_19775 [Promethearchaeia archaeon]